MMPRVTFKADPTLPPHKGGRFWTHAPGGRKQDALPKDAAPGTKAPYRLVEPVRYESGQSFDATEAEAEWLVAHYPQCFTVQRAVPTESDGES
jgi:hypothetical protein